MSKESFSLYGFQISIRDDWRVEVNPKDTRAKADVAFQTPKGNRFFVSWGRLEDAKNRFSNLKEHRDSIVKKLKGGQVNKVSIVDSRDDILNGHEALFSKISLEVNEGMFSKKTKETTMLSVHFYCPEKSRYYVIYSQQRAPAEFENADAIFNEMAKSSTCH